MNKFPFLIAAAASLLLAACGGERLALLTLELPDPTGYGRIERAADGNVRAIVEKLDVRRAQVYVETMIAEVNANQSGEFGIQWLLGAEGSDLSGFVTSALTTGSNNIVTVATGFASGTPTIGNGLNIGLHNGSVTGDNGKKIYRKSN